MAKLQLPGRFDEALFHGRIKLLDWTPQRLNRALKPLEETVQEWGGVPDVWRRKHRKEWVLMKDVAVMVRNCRAALRQQKPKKAVKIYALVQERCLKNRPQK